MEIIKDLLKEDYEEIKKYEKKLFMFTKKKSEINSRIKKTSSFNLGSKLTYKKNYSNNNLLILKKNSSTVLNNNNIQLNIEKNYKINLINIIDSLNFHQKVVYKVIKTKKKNIKTFTFNLFDSLIIYNKSHYFLKNYLDIYKILTTQNYEKKTLINLNEFINYLLKEIIKEKFEFIWNYFIMLYDIFIGTENLILILIQIFLYQGDILLSHNESIHYKKKNLFKDKIIKILIGIINNRKEIFLCNNIILLLKYFIEYIGLKNENKIYFDKIFNQFYTNLTDGLNKYYKLENYNKIFNYINFYYTKKLKNIFFKENDNILNKIIFLIKNEDVKVLSEIFFIININYFLKIDYYELIPHKTNIDTSYKTHLKKAVNKFNLMVYFLIFIILKSETIGDKIETIYLYFKLINNLINSKFCDFESLCQLNYMFLQNSFIYIIKKFKKKEKNLYKNYLKIKEYLSTIFENSQSNFEYMNNLSKNLICVPSFLYSKEILYKLYIRCTMNPQGKICKNYMDINLFYKIFNNLKENIKKSKFIKKIKKYKNKSLIYKFFKKDFIYFFLKELKWKENNFIEIEKKINKICKKFYEEI